MEGDESHHEDGTLRGQQTDRTEQLTGKRAPPSLAFLAVLAWDVAMSNTRICFLSYFIFLVYQNTLILLHEIFFVKKKYELSCEIGRTNTLLKWK